MVDRRESRHAQTLKRGASRSSTDVRNDDQFKSRDIREFNLIFFNLAYRVRRAEVPLLADNFPKRAPAIGRPTHDELLRPRGFSFFKDKRYSPQALRLVKRAESFAALVLRRASPAPLPKRRQTRPDSLSPPT